MGLLDAFKNGTDVHVENHFGLEEQPEVPLGNDLGDEPPNFAGFTGLGTILDPQSAPTEGAGGEIADPFPNRILVLPDPVATTSAAGLYTGEGIHERARSQRGTVVAIGMSTTVLMPSKSETAQLGTSSTGAFLPYELLQSGDRVVFGKYSGIDIQVGSEILRVLTAEDIFVRIRPVTP